MAISTCHCVWLELVGTGGSSCRLLLGLSPGDHRNGTLWGWALLLTPVDAGLQQICIGFFCLGTTHQSLDFNTLYIQVRVVANARKVVNLLCKLVTKVHSQVDLVFGYKHLRAARFISLKEPDHACLRHWHAILNENRTINVCLHAWRDLVDPHLLLLNLDHFEVDSFLVTSL